jgi:hypothetical protein
MFGDPWQVGIEDGLAAWSYLYCRQPSTGRAEARDLVILFNDEGLVTSYRFHTTVGDEHSE